MKVGDKVISIRKEVLGADYGFTSKDTICEIVSIDNDYITIKIIKVSKKHIHYNDIIDRLIPIERCWDEYSKYFKKYDLSINPNFKHYLKAEKNICF